MAGKTFLQFLSVAFLFLAFFEPVFAQIPTTCPTIYGGGQSASCETSGPVTILKTVQNPQTNQFVHDLGVNDPMYQPGTTVTFQLLVKNTTNSKQTKLIVKDILPEFTGFTSGPGKYDSKNKTLTFTIDTLNPKEQKTFTIKAKIRGADQLPGGAPASCFVNQAQLTLNQKTSQDTSQFCVQKLKSPQTLPNMITPYPQTTKGGLPLVSPAPISQSPGTGPETFALLSLPVFGLGGFLLRKLK